MTTMSVSVKTDADGFISQQCPSCDRRFKVKFGEGSSNPVSFCPYCGHADSGWWTEEQRAYCTSVVNEEVVRPMLDDFRRSINRMNRPGSLVQMSANVKHDQPAPEPVESNEPMPLAQFTCCGERIKHDGSMSQLYCIICGTMMDVA